MRLIPAASVAALIAAVACNRAPAQGAAPQGPPPTPVQLAVASSLPVEDATEYVATLKSLNSTTIQPQIDGQITKIFVKSGDHVKQGQPLMQVDPRRQQAAVSSQEAELAARQAAVAFARQQQKRASDLFAAGAISRQELEQADTGLRTAEANLKALEAQLQQQEVQLRYYTITAPTSGIVGDIPVRVGNQVSPQTLLTTVDQNQTLEVYVSVPAERAPDLKPGLPIQVLSSDGQQPLATTTVGFISPHVDDQTQSLLVKGTVRNPDLTLRASQYVRARIVWKTTQGLVVPVTAVLRINGQYFAFVAEEAAGRLLARQRAIKVGPIVGDNYSVLEGVKPNERVIVSGIQKLADGVPIAPQRAASPKP
jgi:RND family efflux transporter MFP subunit